MSVRSVVPASVVLFLLRLPAGATFEAEVSTSFGTLEPGASTTLVQETAFTASSEPPTSIAIGLDLGSFDFDGLAVGDPVGTFDIDITAPVPAFVDLALEVSAVGTGSIDLDGVVTDTDLGAFGIDLDDVLYVITISNSTGEGGEIILSVGPGYGLPDELPFDVDASYAIALDALYVHAGREADLTVTTDLTSALDSSLAFEEVFTLGSVAETEFLRGDVDGNGDVFALVDALALLGWAFTGGAAPPCMDAADFDDSGAASALVDALALLGWAFTGGPPPPAPGPDRCGIDESDDNLTCGASSAGC